MRVPKNKTSNKKALVHHVKSGSLQAPLLYRSLILSKNRESRMMKTIWKLTTVTKKKRSSINSNSETRIRSRRIQSICALTRSAQMKAKRLTKRKMMIFGS